MNTNRLIKILLLAMTFAALPAFAQYETSRVQNLTPEATPYYYYTPPTQIQTPTAAAPSVVDLCPNFEKPEATYFDLCAKEGYDYVCLNKSSGDYQGCTRTSYNDCTFYNTNKDKNILCKAKRTTTAPTVAPPTSATPPSTSVAEESDACPALEKSQQYYFALCAKEGYDNVCLNKTSGKYQGCTKNTYNDCTLHNINAGNNALCKVTKNTSSATAPLPVVPAEQAVTSKCDILEQSIIKLQKLFTDGKVNEKDFLSETERLQKSLVECKQEEKGVSQPVATPSSESNCDKLRDKMKKLQDDFLSGTITRDEYDKGGREIRKLLAECLGGGFDADIEALQDWQKIRNAAFNKEQDRLKGINDACQEIYKALQLLDQQNLYRADYERKKADLEKKLKACYGEYNKSPLSIQEKTSPESPGAAKAEAYHGGRNIKPTINFGPPPEESPVVANDPCSTFSKSQQLYFNLCAKEGYDNVCLNKNTGKYQGCTKNTYNDCTVNNINKAQNILCGAQKGLEEIPKSKFPVGSLKEGSMKEPATEQPYSQPLTKTFEFFKSIFAPVSPIAKPALVVERPSLFKYLANQKNPAEIIAQSCAEVSAAVKARWPSTWVDTFKDSKTDGMDEVEVPAFYVLQLCGSNDTAKIISELNGLRSKTESLLRRQDEAASKPASILKNPAKALIDFFRSFFGTNKTNDTVVQKEQDKNEQNKQDTDKEKLKKEELPSKPTSCCVCTVIQAIGQNDWIQVGEGDWQPAKVGDTITEGGQISNGSNAELKLSCWDHDAKRPPVIITLDQYTQIGITHLICEGGQGAVRAALALDIGSLPGEVKKGEAHRVDFKVKTPALTCDVKG